MYEQDSIVTKNMHKCGEEHCPYLIFDIYEAHFYLLLWRTFWYASLFYEVLTRKWNSPSKTWQNYQLKGMEV